MFSMKLSCTKLSVWVPKSHSAASPFSECKNGSIDSVCICFRDKNRNLSRVRFLFVSNVSSQLFSKSFKDISAIFAFGYLSINVFLAAVPSDKYSTLTHFRSAIAWSKFFNRTLFRCFVCYLS